MIKGASFSKDKLHRFSLFRIWDYELPKVLFIMFNPSEANQKEDDPTIRRVIDFSNFDNGYSILPTGQSGLFRSQHYDDQTEMYNAGEFKPFKFSYDAINDTKSSKLIFKSK